MNAPIDTLAFAQRFEEAGFGHEQARALAAAFGQARESTREGLVTKDYLDARLAEFETRISGDLAAVKGEFSTVKVELSTMKVELVREIATVGKDVNGRLWSTITIVAGTATAISAAISAGVALLLKAGGL